MTSLSVYKQETGENRSCGCKKKLYLWWPMLADLNKNTSQFMVKCEKRFHQIWAGAQ